MPDLAAAVDCTTEEVLERMFFSGILGLGAGCRGADSLSAVVGFSGSLSGSLAVAVDMAAALTCTANFLGASELDTPIDVVSAVVGEFANVLCGATLARISPDGAFQIAPPRVDFGPAAVQMVEAMPVHRGFELPEGNMAVGVSLREEGIA